MFANSIKNHAYVYADSVYAVYSPLNSLEYHSAIYTQEMTLLLNLVRRQAAQSL